MGVLPDEVLVSPATFHQTRRAGPTVDGRPSNAWLGHHGDSGGQCSRDGGLRLPRRASAGRATAVWHSGGRVAGPRRVAARFSDAESVSPKRQVLTNPPRTLPATLIHPVIPFTSVSRARAGGGSSYLSNRRSHCCGASAGRRFPSGGDSSDRFGQPLRRRRGRRTHYLSG